MVRLFFILECDPFATGINHLQSDRPKAACFFYLFEKICDIMHHTKSATEKEAPKMSLAYGIIALISLCMVGVCVAMDKKRDVWLLLVFVSVSLCNLGYFMISVSPNLS